jgi:stage II sporulation protein GA (sporulation sigma-E factor processing peptidase)
MVVYLDVLLLENFIINLFLLEITVKTLKIKTKTYKVVISSLCGSLYVITELYPFLYIFTSIFFKLLVALIMVVMVLKRVSPLVYIKSWAIFIVYSMILAGFCQFLQYNNDKNFSSNDSIFSYKFIILALIVLYFFVQRCVVYIKDRKKVLTFIYNIKIIVNSQVFYLKAFLDTGNELREPASNLPVIIAERKMFSNLFIKNNEKYYIPFKLVDGSNGLLEGFKPSCVKLYFDNTSKDCDVIIALTDASLSDVNDYNALLSRGIF